MSPEAFEWLKAATAVISVITAVVTFLKYLNKTLLGHLEAHFPSKSDFDRLAGRLDALADSVEALHLKQTPKVIHGVKARARDLRPL